jgi:hypothetical protein
MTIRCASAREQFDQVVITVWAQPAGLVQAVPPDGSVEFRDAPVPVSGAGKVLRRELRGADDGNRTRVFSLGS